MATCPLLELCTTYLSQKSAHLLQRVNEKGFTPALINIGRGNQQLLPDYRDGRRVIIDSPELSNYLLEVLRPYLPATLEQGREKLEELNERCRFLCYTPGQAFEAHCDGMYTRSPPHPKAGDRSRVTVQFYLHDVPSAHGGATTFIGGNGKRLPCQPTGGSALIFTQDLFHEGSLVSAGIKYTLRTEAMYTTQPDRAPARNSTAPPSPGPIVFGPPPEKWRSLPIKDGVRVRGHVCSGEWAEGTAHWRDGAWVVALDDGGEDSYEDGSCDLCAVGE